MYWEWRYAGLALAGVFLLTVVLVKPIGVSTQFVILDAWLASSAHSDLIQESEDSAHGYQSTNAYLNKSGGKYAKNAANLLNYGFIFVVSMIAGGFIASRFQKESAPQIPSYHVQRFGYSPHMRYILTFVGGMIVLFGARLAGGCTSGHMMSGMMQTAISGYLFAFSAFLAAIPTAILLYKSGGNDS